MVKIYHNPRCGKSREALKMLTDKGIEPAIIEYMKDPLTEMKMEELLLKLNMDAIDLVRVKEADWKENFKGKELDEAEIILAMIEYPKLMERPIVENGKKAVVARPANKMNEVL
jgi:arsenate reductase (glutaredoxin)